MLSRKWLKAIYNLRKCNILLMSEAKIKKDITDPYIQIILLYLGGYTLD